MYRQTSAILASLILLGTFAKPSEATSPAPMKPPKRYSLFAKAIPRFINVGSSSQQTSDDGQETKETQPRRQAGPRLRYSTVPACEGNDLRLGQADGTMCPAALDACRATVGGGRYLVWTFLFHPARPKVAAFWTLTGQRCVSATEPRDTEPRQAVALSLEDFRRLPLPPGGLHVQPNTGQVLINIDTNVYVTAKPIRLRTEVLGTPVDVEATPDSYTWDFGDGRQLTTRNPGAPYPAMTTTHIYQRPGRYTITLTVNYRGQFRPQGMQDWLPVEGNAPVDSAPVTLEAIETRAVLVP